MNYKRNAKYFRPRPSWKAFLLFLLLGALALAGGIKARPRGPEDDPVRKPELRYDAELGLDVPVPYGHADSQARRAPPPRTPIDGRFSAKELERIKWTGAGLLLVAFGLFCGWATWPRDKTVDAAMNELHDGFRARALQRLGMEEEAVSKTEPLEFCRFECPPSHATDEKGKPLLPVVQGRDKKLRSPVVTMTGFYFADECLHYYRFDKSITSNWSFEDSNEFWYSDIVSVKLGAEEFPAFDKKGRALKNRTVRFDTFIVRNAGGETISCAVNDRGAAQRALFAMRSLLRESKKAKDRNAESDEI